jgi:hypothetical protein
MAKESRMARRWFLVLLVASFGANAIAIRTPGRYGQITCNVRMSHYRDWIESIMSAQASGGPSSSNP